MHWLALLRRNPAFARLWLGEAVSLAGDWFSIVAISVLAVQQGGGQGAFAVAATLAAHDVPMGLMRPIAGVLADRFDRRNLLVGVHVVQVGLTLVMVERAYHADVTALQLLVLARSVVGGLDWPARAGALRRVVQLDDLIAANALSGATWSASYAIGMALGGVAASVGVPFALAIDAGSFAVAAILLMTLPAMPTAAAPGSLWTAARRSVQDLREAWAIARADRDILRAVASRTPLALAGGGGVVLLNVVADRAAFAGTAALSLGLLQAVRGIGTGVGPIVAERILAGGVPLVYVWRGIAVVGLGGVALFTAITQAAPSVWLGALVAAFVWGFGMGGNWVIAAAEVQRTAPDEAIGRLSGLDMLSIELSFAGMALVGGAAIELTGAPVVSGVLGVAVGGLAWLAVELTTRR